MFQGLTGPLLWNHAQALCLILPLKGIEIQDAAGRRETALDVHSLLSHNTFLIKGLTCMSASVPEHLKRSLHPSYPSGIPAFSKKKNKKQMFQVTWKTG